MGKFVDLTGQKFGRWNVVRDSGTRNKNGNAMWECICDCDPNITHLVSGATLKNGRSKSCGCLHREVSANTMSRTMKRYNTYDLSGEYGIGHTSKGELFYFDIEDYDKIKNYCWFANNLGYICANTFGKNKEGKIVLMHRLVMDCDNRNVSIDHINHNVYDNRKANLRLVTQSQNLMNRTMGKNNTSGVTGVWFDSRSSKWVAETKINRVKKSLGRFKNFEDAINARMKAEEELFGEYRFKTQVSLYR